LGVGYHVKIFAYVSKKLVHTIFSVVVCIGMVNANTSDPQIQEWYSRFSDNQNSYFRPIISSDNTILVWEKSFSNDSVSEINFEDTALFQEGNNQFFAVNLLNGEELWRKEFYTSETSNLLPTMYYFDDKLVLHTYEDEGERLAFSIHSKTGEIENQTNLVIENSVVLFETDTFLIYSYENKTFYYDKSTQQSEEVFDDAVQCQAGRAALSDNYLACLNAFSQRKLSLFNLATKVKTTVPLSDVLGQGFSLPKLVASADDVFYFSHGEFIERYDALNEQLTTAYRNITRDYYKSIASRFVVTENSLIVITEDDGNWGYKAISLQSGEVFWQATKRGFTNNYYDFSPIATANHVFIDNGLGLEIVNRHTGEFIRTISNVTQFSLNSLGLLITKHTVANSDIASIKVYDVEVDHDKDGVPSYMERSLGTNPWAQDSDFDGLTDSQEIELVTNPLNKDTDGDGLNDGREVRLGLNPLSQDSDGDGVLDGDEDVAQKINRSSWRGWKLELLEPN